MAVVPLPSSPSSENHGKHALASMLEGKTSMPLCVRDELMSGDSCQESVLSQNLRRQRKGSGEATQR